MTVLVRSGWWYRQERTVEGLSAKQRVEWAQEDTVGGWDARRADLAELGNTGTSSPLLIPFAWFFLALGSGLGLVGTASSSR